MEAYFVCRKFAFHSLFKDKLECFLRGSKYRCQSRGESCNREERGNPVSKSCNVSNYSSYLDHIENHSFSKI